MVAVVTCASFGTAAVGLSLPIFPFDSDGYRSGTTIYPVGIWALVLGGLAAGLGSVALSVQESPRLRSVVASVALVCSLQLAGTGIVARKHWRPAFGVGGDYGNGYDSLGQLQSMSVLIAAAGFIGAAAAAIQLVQTRAVCRQSDVRLRWLCVIAGLAVIAALPLVIKNGAYNASDLTSWGAVGLIYAGPWGVVVMLTGWLTRPSAVAALLSVTASMLLAVVGPQMTGLVYPSPTGPFAVALLAPLLLLTARFVVKHAEPEAL